MTRTNPTTGVDNEKGNTRCLLRPVATGTQGLHNGEEYDPNEDGDTVTDDTGDEASDENESDE